MKSLFKQSLAVILTALMLMSMLPLSTSAAEATPDSVGSASGTTGDCMWKLENNILTIDGKVEGNMADYDAVDNLCPWKDETFNTVRIAFNTSNVGNYAFYECTGITSVILDGCTTIGNNAFEGCRNLTAVRIDSFVKNIGEKAFGYYYDNGYHKVDGFTITGYSGSAAETYANENGFTFKALPNFRYRVLNDGTAEIIGYLGTSSDVIIPSVIDGYTVTGINDAFEDCDILTSVTIPDSVIYIDEFAFSCCSNLTTVNIPNSVKRIGEYVFYRCNNLSSVVIGDSVMSIEERAFYDCSDLSTIIIPDSVATIGEYAFEGCSNLTDVSIGNAVTSIGKEAFSGCGKMTGVTIPNAVTSIGENALGYVYYSKIDDFTITGYKGSAAETYANDNGFNFRTIEDTSVFSYKVLEDDTAEIIGYNGNDDEIIIPSAIDGYTVTNIGDGLFNYCSTLKKITIPDSVIKIGYASFCGCKNLETIIGCNNVQHIGAYAFNGTAWYTAQPYGLVYIGKVVLGYKCEDIFHENCPEDIEIKQGTISIRFYAFGNRSCLSSVIIPDSVIEIDEDAFFDCPNLTLSANEGSYAEQYAKENGIKFIAIKDLPTVIAYGTTGECKWKLTDTGVLTISGNGTMDNYGYDNLSLPWEKYMDDMINTIIIKEGVENIGSEAFMNCFALTNITIPDSVAYIGNGAFRNCTALTNINIPDNVTEIRYGVFENCSALENITIPDGVTNIDSCAFKDCSSLKSIHIPASVTVIGSSDWFLYNDAFEGCSALDSITVDPNNTTFDSRENCNAIIETSNNFLYVGCNNTVIPDGITRIACYAFKRCASLTSIIIPEGVTYIGWEAFEYCSSLTSVTIANSVTGIGRAAFAETGITNIVLPNQLTTITNDTFWGCVKLQSVYIPDSVKSIYHCAFRYCRALKNVNFPNSITDIGGDAFERCTALTSITIPSSVTNISPTAFKECTGLTRITVDPNNTTYDSRNNCNAVIKTENNHVIFGCKNTVIPNNVTSIGSNAFEDCYNLTSMIIPNGITSIGSNAFYNCNKLSSMTIPASVTSIGDNALGYCYSKKKDGFTIIGYHGTEAETYANNNGFIFIPMFSYQKLDDGTAEITSYNGSGGDVIIPSVIDGYTVTQISDWTFVDRNTPTTLTIPDSVTYIHPWTFDECSNLTDIIVDSNNTTYCSIDGNLYSKNATTLIRYMNGKTDASFVIPDTVTTIADSAFYGCTSLTSVTIPDSVIVINDWAFSECKNLTEIQIPSAVTNIGEGAFEECCNLKAIIIPQSVTDIGDDAFDGCGTATDDGFTIYGVKGTAAETYATENEIPFIPICPHCGSTHFKTIPEIPATCDKAGMTEGIYCVNCGEWIVVPKPIPSYGYIPGDVNGDGLITVDDATMLQRFLAEFIELDLTNENVFTQADMNEDGYVNVKDVTAIQRKLADLS